MSLRATLKGLASHLKPTSASTHNHADKTPSLDRASRLRGCLYGLAVGDALGGPYEFQSRGSYKTTGNMEDSYTFATDGQPFKAGTWTDDTSTTLCLAASLIERGELVWEDTAKKMLEWYKNGYLSAVGYCFDIGNGTCSALMAYADQLSRHVPLVLSGSESPSASGNGSLMRLAPIPVYYHNDPLQALKMSDMQSRITHGSAMCLESCRLATAQILGFILEGASPDSTPEERKIAVLSADYLPPGVPPAELEFTTKQAQELRVGIWKEKSAEKIKTSGFVIDSHEAALWALWNSHSYEEGMLLLLPLGSDVDTVCAIYGQLAGALYGYDAIPARWIGALQKRDVLEGIFDVLVTKTIVKAGEH